LSAIIHRGYQSDRRGIAKWYRPARRSWGLIVWSGAVRRVLFEVVVGRQVRQGLGLEPYR
jgi:hypothetical protein